MTETYVIKYIAKWTRRKEWRHWLRPHLLQVWSNVWGVLRNPDRVISIYVFYITTKVFVFHFQMCFIRRQKSNVCICRSLTRQRVDHNALSQWHALLCKWGSFIILMLFVSLIHMERDTRGGSGSRHCGPALFTRSLIPELSFVTSKLNVLKQPTLLRNTSI